MKHIRWMMCILACLFFITPGFSLIIKSGQTIEIAKDEIIDDDLMIFAQTVDIRGRVKGDIVAFAQEVKISGDVEGSIFTGASTIDIDVAHTRSVWAAAGNIAISGNIKNNVILAGGKLYARENANIGKDLMAYGGYFTVEGNIENTIKGGVGTFVMKGSSGDVSINADEIRIASGAHIDGDLIVESGEEPVIEDGAIITGEVRLETRAKEEEKAAFFALAPFIAFFITFIKIVLLIAMIIVGILMIALLKNYTRRIMDKLIQKPWHSLGWGFLILIILPIVIMILFFLLIGFPLAIFGTYIYTIIVYFASIFVALVVGEKIIQLFKKEGEISLYASFIIGILIIFVLSLIPILGFIIKLFVLLFGAGALTIGTWELLKEIQGKKLI